jgi:hypothetical protein
MSEQLQRGSASVRNKQERILGRNLRHCDFQITGTDSETCDTLLYCVGMGDTGARSAKQSSLCIVRQYSIWFLSSHNVLTNAGLCRLPEI